MFIDGISYLLKHTGTYYLLDIMQILLLFTKNGKIHELKILLDYVEGDPKNLQLAKKVTISKKFTIFVLSS